MTATREPIKLDKRVDQVSELKYLLDFAKAENFMGQVARRQLRALMTAYCLRHDVLVDTYEYDQVIIRIWEALNQNKNQYVPFTDVVQCDMYLGTLLS
nr:MAG TPA: hypothetical protein [Caudoviricetes sp.]